MYVHHRARVASVSRTVIQKGFGRAGRPVKRGERGKLDAVLKGVRDPSDDGVADRHMDQGSRRGLRFGGLSPCAVGVEREEA